MLMSACSVGATALWCFSHINVIHRLDEGGIFTTHSQVKLCHYHVEGEREESPNNFDGHSVQESCIGPGADPKWIAEELGCSCSEIQIPEYQEED